MDDEDLLPGTIVGLNLTRYPTPIGPLCNLDSIVVSLADGREVTAVLDLPPLKKSFMVRMYAFGSLVKLKLGTVLEPIRIVEVLDPPDPPARVGG